MRGAVEPLVERAPHPRGVVDDAVVGAARVEVEAWRVLLEDVGHLDLDAGCLGECSLQRASGTVVPLAVAGGENEDADAHANFHEAMATGAVAPARLAEARRRKVVRPLRGRGSRKPALGDRGLPGTACLVNIQIPG